MTTQINSNNHGPVGITGGTIGVQGSTGSVGRKQMTNLEILNQIPNQLIPEKMRGKVSTVKMGLTDISVIDFQQIFAGKYITLCELNDRTAYVNLHLKDWCEISYSLANQLVNDILFCDIDTGNFELRETTYYIE